MKKVAKKLIFDDDEKEVIEIPTSSTLPKLVKKKVVKKKVVKKKVVKKTSVKKTTPIPPTSSWIWWNYVNLRDLYNPDPTHYYEYRFPGGMYVIAPNVTGESIGPARTLLKIGIARDLEHRLNSYKTPWPNGAQILFLLVFDNAGQFRRVEYNDEEDEFELTLPSEEKDKLIRFFLETLEAEIFDILKSWRYTCIDHGALQRSTCEWFFAPPEEILKAFLTILVKYNGCGLKDGNRKGRAQLRLFSLLPHPDFTTLPPSIPPLLEEVESQYDVTKKQFKYHVSIASRYLSPFTFSLKENELKKGPLQEKKLNAHGTNTPGTPSFKIGKHSLKSIEEVATMKKKITKKTIAPPMSKIIPM